MMRGGGCRSVKYEEVITLVAAGRTYFETKRRLETTFPGDLPPCDVEHRKGGVVAVVAKRGG